MTRCSTSSLTCRTVCLGLAASAAAILLAAGAKGKRLILPNARVLIHQPAIDQGFGKATEIEIQAREMLRMREWLENTLAKHTGQDVERIRKDIEVDTFLTAPEAKEYGIVDGGARTPFVNVRMTFT